MVTRRERWHDKEERFPFASAHHKIHQVALKTAYAGYRRTNMLHTHYNQNVRKEEAVRFWGILPNLAELKAKEPSVSP